MSNLNFVKLNDNFYNNLNKYTTENYYKRKRPYFLILELPSQLENGYWIIPLKHKINLNTLEKDSYYLIGRNCLNTYYQDAGLVFKKSLFINSLNDIVPFDENDLPQEELEEIINNYDEIVNQFINYVLKYHNPNQEFKDSIEYKYSTIKDFEDGIEFIYQKYGKKKGRCR